VDAGCSGKAGGQGCGARVAAAACRCCCCYREGRGKGDHVSCEDCSLRGAGQQAHQQPLHAVGVAAAARAGDKAGGQVGEGTESEEQVEATRSAMPQAVACYGEVQPGRMPVEHPSWPHSRCWYAHAAAAPPVPVPAGAVCAAKSITGQEHRSLVTYSPCSSASSLPAAAPSTATPAPLTLLPWG